jgi:hypothetical protein
LVADLLADRKPDPLETVDTPGLDEDTLSAMKKLIKTNT